MDLEVRISPRGDTDNLRDLRVAIETLRFQSGAGRISLTGAAGLDGFTISGETSGLRAMLLDAGVATPEAADLDDLQSDDLFDDDVLWNSFPCRPRSWDPAVSSGLAPHRNSARPPTHPSRPVSGYALPRDRRALAGVFQGRGFRR